MNDFVSVFVCFFIFIVFWMLFELVRRATGKDNVYDYNRDIKRISKEDKIPKIKDEEKVLLGMNGKKEICLPTKISHAFVCGTTGSGKTVVLSNFIKSAMEYNYPLLIVDGKGDISDNSLLDIVHKLNTDRKIYVVNMNDPQNSDKYNPFKNTSSTVIKDMLINLTTWSEEHYKLNMERYLQRVIDLLFKAEIELSFETIVKYMMVEEFQTINSQLFKDKIISKEEQMLNNKLAEQSEKIVEGAIARFSTIIESELGTIFDGEGIDIYTAIKENAVILFVLNPLLYPELSPLIGNLVIIDSKKAVSKMFRDNIKRSFFIFDEINVYASKSLLDLVNKSRSANVTCILSAQSLSDLETAESESFKEQVIENCNNYIILRQNNAKNAEEWANTVGTKPTVGMTYQVKNEHNSISDTGGSARPIRDYIVHPDNIKNFTLGKGFIVSKDKNFKKSIDINKPF